MLMIAAYVRVSSRSQNFETQQDAIKRASKARGDRVRRWYSEKVSTAKSTRPELDRLREDVRGGHVTRVYVYRLDRISRGGIRETLSLVNELQHGGCQLETIADGFSLGGPTGEVVLAVLAWAAQMERAAIGERIASARTRVEASGGHWGRPRRVSADEVKHVRSMREKEGKTIRYISIALKIPKATVSDILSENGVYKRALPKGVKMRKKLVAPLLSE